MSIHRLPMYKAKMEKTFSHRRLKIVEERPMIGVFKDRWPALFQESGVNEEFLWITTKPLQTKFLAQLDHFSEKLFQIFESKGGVKGQKIKRILAIKDERDDINIRRECVLKSLIIYLNEDPDSLFKEFLPSAAEDAENIVDTVMGIHTVRQFEEPDDIGVVIEGVKVLNNVGSATMAFIMLFGLIYALDLSFPDNLKYTFEFVQKILMNLDGHRLNTKIQQLKIKLFM